MHSSLQTIKNALAYASFTNKEVRLALNEAINTVGADLQAEDYEPSPETEQALSELETALNEADSDTEEINDAIGSATVDDDEDDEENEDDENDS